MPLFIYFILVPMLPIWKCYEKSRYLSFSPFSIVFFLVSFPPVSLPSLLCRCVIIYCPRHCYRHWRSRANKTECLLSAFVYILFLPTFVVLVQLYLIKISIQVKYLRNWKHGYKLSSLSIHFGKINHISMENSHIFKIFIGRNALHLAAKYGHALCLQKLLQVVQVVNIFGVYYFDCK